MGNVHPRAIHTLKQRKKKGRRLSVPTPEVTKNMGALDLALSPHQAPPSFVSCGSPVRGPSPSSTAATPPRIQINGLDSLEAEESFERSFDDNEIPIPSTMPKYSTCSLPTGSPPSSSNSSVSSTRSTPPSSKPAAIRRMEFLTSSGNLTVRSLDDGNVADVELAMKPLGKTKSLSPLKQLRTYSYRSLSSEENYLDKEHCDAIRLSWRLVQAKAKTTNRDFSLFVFQRIFERAPHLKALFKVEKWESVTEIPEEDSFHRHARLFTNIIELAVKNVDELESQIAPVMFTYGQRHFATAAAAHFDEETVRMFCGQVVCTVVDFLGEHVEPLCMEAWIEMMRYLGRKLLDGFEFARIGTKRRFSINKNDHHLFLML